MTEYRQMCVKFVSQKTGELRVHPDLRARLIADAEETGTNLNEVIVRILSRKLRVEYVPTGRTSKIRRDEVDQIHFRISTPLARALEHATSASPKYGRPAHATKMAVDILHAHYGLRAPALPLAKGGRRKAEPAKAA